MWILNGIIGRLESRMSARAETIDEFITATYVSILGTPVALGASVAALLVVRRINAMQEHAVGNA